MKIICRQNGDVVFWQNTHKTTPLTGFTGAVLLTHTASQAPYGTLVLSMETKTCDDHYDPSSLYLKIAYFKFYLST